jgi:phosphate transport system permease protein
MIITLLITVPTGVFAAVYMTQYARKRRFVQLMRSTTDVLAGIPSVIFGLFGYAVFCSGLKLGVSIISGCLTMMICTLPTIIRTAEESLSNVPRMFFDAAAALGTGKVKIIFEIIIPAAIPGILTSVILCAEKILGESAALIYTTGMSAKMPSNFFSHALRSGRTLTLHLYQTAKQANTEDALSQAFATASVLLIIIFILNLSAEFFLKRIKKQRHLS